MNTFSDFLDRLKKCVADHKFKIGDKVLNEDEVVVGYGNHESKILFVGKESTSDPKEAHNSLSHNFEYIGRRNWTRIREDEEDFCTDSGKNKPNYWTNSGALWWKYQRLVDYIRYGHQRNRSKEFDFENYVYCTEMNNSHSKKTVVADKTTLDWRKEIFFKDVFFKDFSVIVLACSNYIVGKEIEDIFKVRFTEAIPSALPKPNMNNTFWCHYSNDRKRLVIHTRNLSGAVNDAILRSMAKVIASHLKNNGQFDSIFSNDI